MKSSEVSAALGALASEPRLAVFRLLVKRGPDGFTPSEPENCCGLADAACDASCNPIATPARQRKRAS